MRENDGHDAKQVILTDGEKLIAVMLCDIYKHLKIKGNIDAQLVSSAIHGGHLWALEEQLSGLFHRHVDSPHDVSETINILDMWSFIEEGSEALQSSDQDTVKKQAPQFGGGKFPGFDGNNETTHLSIARFLIDDMSRFDRFRGRDLNSHYPYLSEYRKMFMAFEPIRATLDSVSMNATQVVEVLLAASDQ